MPKVFAKSVERYNGGVKYKRLYGSSTVTVFLVGLEGSPAGTWMKLEGYGATPGERKTYALKVFALAQDAGLVRADVGLGSDIRKLLK